MFLIPVITALLVTMATVPVSIWAARKLDTLDRPDARKIHFEPTPRLGGIAIFLGLVTGVFGSLLWLYGSGKAIEAEGYTKLAAIGGASAFIFLVGLVDDIRSVSSRFKLIALIGGATMVCGSGVVLADLLFGGQALIEFRWVSWAVTMLWIIAVAVAINFIDGLDGLAGGLTLMSAAVLSFFAVSAGKVELAILPLALVGALSGFLVFNWHPAKTFMGDGGSMLIGFVLASSVVFANQELGTMRGLMLPMLAISVPLADTALTVFRRHYLQRRSLFAAERGHIHHRLLDRGLPHKHAVLVIYLVSALAVGIGLISLVFEGWATLGGLALLVPLLWGTFRLAGSVRTTEMVDALRGKRALDRASRQYRNKFEELQLEFHHVRNFAQWWEGMCRAADRLDFVKLTLKLPVTDKSDRSREMAWRSENKDLVLGDCIQAAIPIATSHPLNPSAQVSVEIAASRSLESASERLALFARLMTENSLAKISERERQDRLHQRPATHRIGQKRSSARKSSLASLDRSIDEQLGPQRDDDGDFAHLRVAIVHDFMYTYAGAERVVEQLIHVFPHGDLFALFDFLPETERGFLQGKPVTTTFLQNMPFAKTKHRSYLPLMPIAVEQLDVSDYDLVITSSYLAAKGVITGPDQLHICYCHSPVRYAWDLHHQYLSDSGLGYGPKGLLARAILHYIRSWDVRSSLGVDHFIANSQFVARRIKKVYRRTAAVIHPPVDTKQFELSTTARDDFYLVVGRMVPYKRTDMIVNAFGEMPDRKLVVIGEGPGFEKVKSLAGDNVTLMGFQDGDVLVDHMQRAKALIFVAEEDFGIVPVEALACGTPVIAYGKGGVTESVVDGEHGVLFEEQTEDSLIDALDRFESQNEFSNFDPQTLHIRSEEFSEETFSNRIKARLTEWTSQRSLGRGGARGSVNSQGFSAARLAELSLISAKSSKHAETIGPLKRN
tara:strand:- start:96487 stop:99342 length:2856 start_codon:yes stop_codon:yes gene_type:complete